MYYIEQISYPLSVFITLLKKCDNKDFIQQGKELYCSKAFTISFILP